MQTPQTTLDADKQNDLQIKQKFHGALMKLLQHLLLDCAASVLAPYITLIIVFM